MARLNEIPPFPNPAVRLIKEDEHVAIWEEIFEPGKPIPPHRHTVASSWKGLRAQDRLELAVADRFVLVRC